jgi:hypothetical protein
MEDEQVKQQRKLQAIIQGVQTQVDVSTPDGLSELANRLNEFPEFSGIALAMRQEAAKAKLAANEAQLKEGLVKAQTGKYEAEAAKASKEKTETVVLPPGATLVSKTTGEVVAQGTAQGGNKIKTVDLGDRVEYYTEGETKPFKVESKGETPSTSFRREIQDLKTIENQTKQQQALQGASDNALRVLNQVKESKDLVGDYTTGAIGGALAVLPQTDARKFANRIKTIKANLGFDRLQQMRDASPTGGALGQVAVQEIEFLQSTIATLDQLESKEDIIKALTDIEKSYQRWLDVVKGKQSGASTTPKAEQTRTTKSGVTYTVEE